MPSLKLGDRKDLGDGVTLFCRAESRNSGSNATIRPVLEFGRRPQSSNRTRASVIVKAYYEGSSTTRGKVNDTTNSLRSARILQQHSSSPTWTTTTKRRRNTYYGASLNNMFVVLLLLAVSLLTTVVVDGFVIVGSSAGRSIISYKEVDRLTSLFEKGGGGGSNTDFGGDEVAAFGDGGIQIDDLNWRVEKLRLEEQNRNRFLKSKPRFLPYNECRKWVQGWGRRWENEQDWKEWIAMGEKRNSYIPSRPDEYYGDQWISWEHFLGTEGAAGGGSE